MPGRPPKYTPEFKEQAIKAVIDGKRSVAQVAHELGISSKTLGPWVTATAGSMLAGKRREKL